MNTNLLAIVKQIITEHGEGILGDPQRLKAFFSDLAKEEPKPLRMAFGRCVEAGAYAALKTAPDQSERAGRKAAIAQRLRDEQGLDITLYAEALDVLETALYGTARSQAAYQQPNPIPAQPSAWQQPAYQQAAPYQQTNPAPVVQPPQQPQSTPPPVQIYLSPQNQNSPQTPQQPAVRTGGLWTAVLVLNILGLNWVSRFITGHIGTGILILLLDIVTIATISIGIGVILLLAGLVIWIIDLVKIGTKKWQMSDGTYLAP
ncbi:MAG: hypothetical protein Pg6C_11730 [Treponemataceae bacterium]|nr:MAG: hypothetical protein Pg6C_11730 [Treponemataceae bacterium]